MCTVCEELELDPNEHGTGTGATCERESLARIVSSGETVDVAVLPLEELPLPVASAPMRVNHYSSKDQDERAEREPLNSAVLIQSRNACAPGAQSRVG